MSRFRGLAQWSGFIVSVVCSMLCGITPAFNVYAVHLKELFDFNQTQVDLLGAFGVAGYSFLLVGSAVYNRYGYKAGYALTAGMVVPSFLLLSVTAFHPKIFRPWFPLLCLLQYTASAGALTGLMICTDIGIKLFLPRHNGKIISVYIAAIGLGKVFFTATYQLFFLQSELLGGFFLQVALSFTMMVCLSYLLHRPVTLSVERESLLSTPECGENVTAIQKGYPSNEENVRPGEHDETEPLPGETDTGCIRDLLFSASFQLILWSGVIFQASFLSMMNVCTEIANSVGLREFQNVVYPLAVILTVSRLSTGIAFDYFKSQLIGFFMLLFCYVSFGIAVLIAIFWLNYITVYAIMAIAAIGMGAGYNLPLVIASSQFGSKHFTRILASNEVCLAVTMIVFQVLSGVSYDIAAGKLKDNSLFCKDCFYGTFMVMLCGTLLSTALLVIDMIYFIYVSHWAKKC